MALNHMEPKYFLHNVASGTTGSTNTAVDMGGNYDRVYVSIPTFTSGGTCYIQGSHDNSDFRRIWTNAATGGSEGVFQFAQGGNQIMQIPAGFRYYKLENTTGVTDATLAVQFIGC